MALFKKLISAVKKFLRGRPPSRNRKWKRGLSRRSLKRKRPVLRLRPKRVKGIKRFKKMKKKPAPARKAPLKKAVAKALSKKPSQPAAREPKGVLIGEVTHYFSKIMVCVVKVTHASFSVGDHIRIQGNGAAFAQKVVSLQIESQDVRVAPKGQLVGLKVAQSAKPGDKVFKL